MDIITILNSAPVGVLLGIIVTKTFDILNKKVEYRQEEKKILYTKKLEVSEKAIQYLHTYYEELLSLKITISQALENRKMNYDLFVKMWKTSHENIKIISDKTTEMFNKTYLYFNIDIDKFHLVESNKELYENVSDLLNIDKLDEIEEKKEVLKKYQLSIEAIMKNQKKLIEIIIKESKTK